MVVPERATATGEAADPLLLRRSSLITRLASAATLTYAM